MTCNKPYWCVKRNDNILYKDYDIFKCIAFLNAACPNATTVELLQKGYRIEALPIRLAVNN
jgi:hypothetical protein